MQFIKLILFAFLLTGISVCNNGQKSTNDNTNGDQDADKEANEALQEGKKSLDSEEKQAFHELELKIVDIEELLGEIKNNREKLSDQELQQYEKYNERLRKIEELLHKKEQAKKQGEGDMEAIKQTITKKTESLSDSVESFHNSLDLE